MYFVQINKFLPRFYFVQTWFAEMRKTDKREVNGFSGVDGPNTGNVTRMKNKEVFFLFGKKINTRLAD